MSCCSLMLKFCRNLFKNLRKIFARAMPAISWGNTGKKNYPKLYFACAMPAISWGDTGKKYCSKLHASFFCKLSRSI